MRGTRLLGWLVGVGAAVLAASLAAAPSRAAAPVAYRVVVHPSSGAAVLERRFVSEAFLRRATRWSDGRAIRPVDLSGDSAVRERFSEEVLGRSIGAVKSYWQQLVFSGRDLPPPELDGDEAVVRYVATHEGAIGYVSGAANVERVKPVAVR